MPNIGDKLNGKLYAGPDYGYQSPATYEKLKNEGAFKVGAQQVRRLKSSLLKVTPEPLKDAVNWFNQSDQRANQRYLDRGYTQQQIDSANAERDQYTMSGQATQQAINTISDATNIAPEVLNVGLATAEGIATGKVGQQLINKFRQARLLKTSPNVPKGEILYHGTSDEAAAAITKGGFKPSGKTTGVFGQGVYSTPDDYYASAYAHEAAYGARNPNAKGVLFQGTVPSGAHILDLSKTNSNPIKLAKQLGVKDLSKWVQERGYDGIKFKPISGAADFSNDEVLIFNPKYADQMFGAGIHSSGQPFPSQGSPLKQRPTPKGSGFVPTRQSQGAGVLDSFRQQLRNKQF